MNLMSACGACDARNLAGGGSTTKIFQGRVVNNPTTNERSNRERSERAIVSLGN